MRDIGSTRTETPWRCCNARRAARRTAARRLTAGAALLVAGCVKSATTYYMPTPGEARLRPDDARTQLDAFVAIECPRLVQAGRSISKDGLIAVELDREGLVTRSRVETTIGDKRIDAIFGAVAAKLRFDPPAAATADVGTGRIRAGYACSDKAAVATLEPLGR